MVFVSEIEAVSATGIFQRVRTINEKHGVVNVVFLAEFSKERVSDYAFYGCFKPCIRQFVCFEIGSSVQPILLVIELDHSFVDDDVIRISTRFGL